jgi:hypothetical protein
MKHTGEDSVQAVLEEAFVRGERDADPADVAEADRRLDELLEQVADPRVSQAPGASPVASASAKSSPGALQGVAMRTAQPVAIKGKAVTLRVRGEKSPVAGELGPAVARELLKQAIVNGDAVIVECVPGETPLVVGVLQTRIPEQITLRAKKIHIDADDEVLIRSGRGAMRIRQDGDVEIVGSRISAMSRGLFRLVGRVLRLN